MKRIILFAFMLAWLAAGVCAQPLQRVAPQLVGLDGERLAQADVIINKAIADEELPGAVLAIVRGGKLAYLKAYGHRSVVPKALPMTESTVFDMASCSKVLGTTTCVMKLMEQGKIRLQDNVSFYIPGFQGWVSADGKQKVNITVEHLLTHTSGLPPYVAPAALRAKCGETANRDSLISYIATCKRDFKPSTAFQYSCLNFITLQRIVETVSGMSLREYAKRNVFGPLGMTHTDYLPCHLDAKSGWWVNDEEVTITDDAHPIAPTERQVKGKDRCYLGQVHDPLAREINLGVSGNAGLFTTAEDVAILCAMLQNGGEYNGVRILSPLTIKAMRTVPRAELPLGRCLGWDLYSPYASNVGNLFSPQTYGHTGYTGTSVIIDPVNDVSVIFLTNRAHPDDGGACIRIRTVVANAIAGALLDPRKGFSGKRKAATEKYFPRYYDRYLQFEREPAITSEDIVMLGNSLTENGGDWGKKLGWKHVVNRGIIGDELMGIYDRLHQILPGKPKKIYLMSGANDVSHHLSTGEIIRRFALVIDRIRTESPATELVVESLLPINESFKRYKNLDGMTAQFPEINEALSQLCAERGVKFVNLFPLFVEPGTNVMRAELTRDGLHLIPEGYKIWVKALKEAK